MSRRSSSTQVTKRITLSTIGNKSRQQAETETENNWRLRLTKSQVWFRKPIHTLRTFWVRKQTARIKTRYEYEHSYTAAQCIVIGPVCGSATAGGRVVSEPYSNQRELSVCVSLSAFFIVDVLLNGLFSKTARLVLLTLLWLHRAKLADLRGILSPTASNTSISRVQNRYTHPTHSKNWHWTDLLCSTVFHF